MLVKRPYLLKPLIALAFLGAMISAYSTYEHYSTGASLCNFNAQFNCDRVNRSAFSEIKGIPVAVVGFLGYLWLATLSFELIKRPRQLVRRLIIDSSAIALSFTFYLAWVSHFIIGVWCPACICSYIIITAFSITAFLTV